ncbi:SdiA-regulated domain-containing protein [Salegentibacter sp. F188]|uniref:SdiA-regulated domain-containing protein n=1 Tax=Autumnicola patrickiae TaxID=3075591 RepID=A0ABU3E2H5_9FLAO|nr:SdiA-regulated domain-containing protein [Salegentibacter sp. F188]MDT0690103.1 SdiA-regulated domain-containing protein [Salegentibacter sp. F188]
MTKIVLWIIAAIMAVAAILYFVFKDTAYISFDDSEKTYEIKQRWDLPDELEEVSGLSWIGDNRIACIQDEDGIIFIYDISTSRVVSEYKFAGPGDYEAVAVDAKNAFVMRSDGRIFHVLNFTEDDLIVNEYQTPLDQEDVEGLALDSKNNRLLLTIKETKRADPAYKGIFSFDLDTMKMDEQPFFIINSRDSIFGTIKGRGAQKIIRPSEIEIHPITGEIYILDGFQPKLMIFNPQGDLKQIHLLDPEKFQQPEGLTFDSAGTLYISNESRRAPANILEVELNNTN